MMNRVHKNQKPSIIYHHSTYVNMHEDLEETWAEPVILLSLEARNTLTMGCFSRKERVCDCHSTL